MLGSYVAGTIWPKCAFTSHSCIDALNEWFWNREAGNWGGLVGMISQRASRNMNRFWLLESDTVIRLNDVTSGI